MIDLPGIVAGLPHEFVDVTTINLIEEDGSLHCRPHDLLQLQVREGQGKVLIRPFGSSESSFCRFKVTNPEDMQTLLTLINSIDPKSYFIQFVKPSKNSIQISITVFKVEPKTSIIPQKAIAVPTNSEKKYSFACNNGTYTVEIHNDKSDKSYLLNVEGEKGDFLEVSEVTPKESGLFEKDNPLFNDGSGYITVCKPITSKDFERATKGHKLRFELRRNHFKFVTKDNISPKTALDNYFSNPTLSDEYLKMWAEFSQKEKELIINKIDRIGTVQVRCVEFDEDGFYHFEVKNPDKWRRILKESSEGNIIDTIALSHKDDNRSIVIAIDFDLKIAMFDTNKFVCSASQGQYSPIVSKDYDLGPRLSIQFEAMFDRREKAIEKYISGATARDDLQKILRGIPGTSMSITETLRMPEEVRREVFGNSFPTADQAEAIQVALNTPDIAIIQGPPGCGKTKVINAIAASLPKPVDDEYKDLFTSYQNVATNNMASSQSKAMDFPFAVVKNGIAENVSEEEVVKWAKNKCDQIRTKYPNIDDYLKPTVEMNNANILKNGYEKRDLECPHSIAENSAFLDDVLTRFKNLSDEQRKQLENLKSEVLGKKIKKSFRRVALYHISNIPHTITTFNDGGVLSARMSISNVEPSLNMLGLGISNTLKDKVLALYQCFNDPVIDFEKIYAIKSEIATYLNSYDESSVDANLNAKIKLFLSDLCRSTSLRKREGVESIVAEYLLNLESHPLSITEAVKRFQDRYFSTHQKSVTRNAPQIYRNVFVDEAARSNPIDLLIPLVRTKGRIVLVGDQNQLPHYLDEGVYDEMDIAKYGDKKELLKMSFFERLVQFAISMEKADGRKRFVRLRTQFRMPEALGDYIGDEFYSTDAFGNPLPESIRGLDTPKNPALTKLHEHNFIPEIKNVPLVFLKYKRRNKVEMINKSSGSEEEAEAILNFLMKSLDNIEENKNLSIGIITVYTNQKRILEEKVEIYKKAAAEKLGMLYSVYNSIYGLNIKIDTIDSFQGGEQDIVIVSIVRGLRDAPEESKIRFIANRNRINVALSRAKRCCILAADYGLFENNDTKEYESLKPLRRFYEICKEGVKGKIYE